MKKTRGHILWVDDEIEHLKPHILFLEEKGYNLSKVNNGQDAIEIVKNNYFDLVLLDQSMPGMDGLEVLSQLKKQRKTQLIIMITKTEDEWLMDEAITGQVEQLLFKPVNPNQIFMACKQALEKKSLSEERATREYLKEFQELNDQLRENLSSQNWWLLYDKLVEWQLKFDLYKDIGLETILDEQIQTCNKEFSSYIERSYVEWLKDESRPRLSTDVFRDFVKPRLEKNEKVCLLVVDCMRYDHFKSILPALENIFTIDVDFKFSLLPTATPYSRNSIFSGIFPDEMVKKYKEQAIDMQSDSSSLNKHEKLFLEDQLIKYDLKNKKIHYHKIWAVQEGEKFKNRMKDFLQKDMLALVVNFVDILAHNSSQSGVLKEMVPDEAGYRSAVKSWFDNSWLLDVLKVLSENDWTVVLTSDHGSIRVKNDIMVAADKGASSGVRYKHGRNLNSSTKNALVIKDPAEYKLPAFGHQPSYVIAKDENYFVYPNDVHKYQNKFKNSFQHGGISMEEMMVPIGIMKRKKNDI